MLFKTIIENDNEQRTLRARQVIPFSPMAELIRDRRNLRRGAELALRWDTDKGKAK